MTRDRTSEFKVVIVGGSVAGLTLAHCFEKAKIDYALLEARDTISPQLGASIVIMANGARILDQLGVYNTMRRDFMTTMAKSHIWRSDGRLVSSNEWPSLVEAWLGYPAGICARRDFLKSLYDQLKDNSKILLNKKVQRITPSKNSVSVLCADGTEFIGDIVVGADGVHSKTRAEMQRHARETGPLGLMAKDEKSITAEYDCIFGISEEISSLNPGDSHTTTEIDHSGLLFVGRHGLPQWFFFSKMDKKYQGKDIPRYTKAEMEAKIEEFAAFHLTDKIKLRDLMRSTKSLSFLSLEEANHEFWTYGRVACLGDSIHKMTPNFGQGGNQAIESVAVLTDCLVELLNRTSRFPVSSEDIEFTLTQYQNIRQHRTKEVVKLSGLITRNQALASLRHTLQLLYEKPLSGEQIASRCFPSKL